MTVTWGDYEIFDPGISGPLETLPRREARQAFNMLMRVKPQRIDMLRQLLRTKGRVELANTDPAIHSLNDWFRLNVEAEPGKPGWLLPEWYSVASDIALFLGEVVIERCPGLRWEFYTWGKKNVRYQRPVIMGFSQVLNPRYAIDLHAAVAAYGHRIIGSHGSIRHHGHVTIRGVEIDIDAVSTKPDRIEIDTDAFRHWVKLAESQA